MSLRTLPRYHDDMIIQRWPAGQRRIAGLRNRLGGPWDRFVYRSEDPRPPGQDYITLLPEDIDSRLDRGELSWAAYAEQVFEREHWDLRLKVGDFYEERKALNVRPRKSSRLAVLCFWMRMFSSRASV